MLKRLRMYRREFAKLLFVAFVVIGAFLPAYAQDETLDATLRSELRTIMLSDPRAASLSEQELEAMLGALIQEVKEQGALEDFVLPAPPAGFYLEAASEETSVPWSTSFYSSTLYLIIITCLLIAILLLSLLLRTHRKTSPMH